MKLAIVGGRKFKDWPLLQSIVDAYPYRDEITTIVSGGALGTDSLAEFYADTDHLDKDIRYPDKSRGIGGLFERNSEIAERCDHALVFWDGASTGTLDTVNKIAKLRKPFTIYYYLIDEFESFNYGKSAKTL
jgi:hypothetical protein